MAYDVDLAERLRELLATEAGITEQKMFGGLAFLVGGHLAVSASGQGGLLLNVPKDDTAAMANEPRASRAVMRGREMDGWLRIDMDGADESAATETELRRWVGIGVAHARSLPPK